MLSERPMDWTHWLCVITRGLDAVVRGSQLSRLRPEKMFRMKMSP